MAKLEMINFWKNKRVIITGHSGFKGSWLTCWLIKKNAKVFGLSLDNKNKNSLYYKFKNKLKFFDKIGNIKNLKTVKDFVNFADPDIIFHLAAQPLVRDSYDNPLDTWMINTIGTINLLESVKNIRKKCSLVLITTDKVYDNNNTKCAFTEKDKLGGLDPYSSSKAAAELAIYSWVKSFNTKNNLRVSVARAGNVLGGGDWGKDRIFPDIIKGIEKKKIVKIRNPNAIRPWQHVIDCLWGYIKLAEYSYRNTKKDYDAFNFGPNKKEVIKVRNLIEVINRHCRFDFKFIAHQDNKVEAQTLFLSNNKSKRILKWYPIISTEKAIEMCLEWYNNKEDGLNIAIRQIKAYEDILR